jgi:Protein of unknown function (DUF2878)
MRAINAIGFQLGWWACVASAGHALEIPALFFCAALVGAHLYFAQDALAELRLAGIALLLGIVLDTALQSLSVIQFYGWALGPLSPFWLWALWVMFALTLNASLSFLQTQPLALSALLGLVFGPLSYVAGAEFGAAEIDLTALHLLVLGVVWMVAMPVMVIAAKHPEKDMQEN